MLIGYLDILFWKKEVLIKHFAQQLDCLSSSCGIQQFFGIWLGILCQMYGAQMSVSRLVLPRSLDEWECSALTTQFTNVFLYGRCSVSCVTHLWLLLWVKIFCRSPVVFLCKSALKTACTEDALWVAWEGRSLPCRWCAAVGPCCESGDPEVWLFLDFLFCSSVSYLSLHWHLTVSPPLAFHLTLSAAVDDHCLHPLLSSRVEKAWDLNSTHFD